MPIPQVKAHQCQRTSFGRSSCRACLDACPAESIKFDGNNINISSRCTGCGICAAICPNDVFEVTNVQSEAVPVIYCSRLLSQKIKPTQILPAALTPCIAALSDSCLLGLFRILGATVELVTGQCAECALKGSLSVFQRNLERASAILQVLGVNAAPVFVREARPADAALAESLLQTFQLQRETQTGFSRRDFFRSLRGGPVQSAPVIKQGSEHDPGPALAQEVMAWLTEVRTGSVPAMLSFWGTLRVADDCDGCGACVAICPFNALDFRKDDARAALLWNPFLCSQCGLCSEACRQGAMSWSPGLDTAPLIRKELILLKEFGRAICPVCRKERIYLSREADCPHCRKEEQLLGRLSHQLYGES